MILERMLTKPPSKASAIRKHTSLENQKNVTLVLSLRSIPVSNQLRVNISILMNTRTTYIQRFPPYFILPTNVLKNKKGATLTVERTSLACFSCHSVRSYLTFEIVGISDISKSSASKKIIPSDMHVSEHKTKNKTTCISIIPPQVMESYYRRKTFPQIACSKSETMLHIKHIKMAKEGIENQELSKCCPQKI